MVPSLVHKGIFLWLFQPSQAHVILQKCVTVTVKIFEKYCKEESSDIPLVVLLESNYIAFSIHNLIFVDGVLNCSLSFIPLLDPLSADRLLKVPMHSFSRYSEQVDVYQLFLWYSFFFFAVTHPIWILLQGSAMPSFSFALLFRRPHLPYSCLATFEAIPVPLDPAFSVRNGFEDQYKR